MFKHYLIVHNEGFLTTMVYYRYREYHRVGRPAYINRYGVAEYFLYGVQNVIE
jgi:hypothetical protein